MNSIKVIAEIGINHNGDIKKAKKLIDIAKKSGADIVKFQTYEVDDLLSPNEPKMEYQKRNDKRGLNQYDLLKKCQLNYYQHKLLIKYCKKKNIGFLSTPYDTLSANLLKRLRCKTVKISSSDTNNMYLLDHCLKLNLDLIISTGATTEKELDQILKKINIKKFKKKIKILHCVSNYPASKFSTNLSVINRLKNKYGISVGFSDHTNDINFGMYAAFSGANLLEKHITLNKNDIGPDHKASLKFSEFLKYVKNVRYAEKILGKSKKIVTNEEKKIKSQMRKSLVFAKNMNKNEKIKISHLKTKRPSKGIPPLHYKKLLGRKIKFQAKKNQLVNIKNII